MPETRRSRLLRYGVAFLAVALTTALRWLLEPLVRGQAPYTASFLAVAVAAWYGGFGPSLAALLGSAAVSTYLFTLPQGSFVPRGIENWVALLLFLFTGAIIVLLGNLRIARRREEHSVATLKDSPSRLFDQVEVIEKAMEVAPTAILVALDPACQQITGNRAANELYGVDGKINFSLTPPAGEMPAQHRYFAGGKELFGNELPMQQAAAEDREIRNLELQVLRQDGRQFTLFGGAIPLHDENGHVRGCIAAFVDITARKKAEDTLRKLSQAIEQNPVSVVITDLDGNIEYVNRKFCRLTGYTAAEALGKNPRLLKSGHTSDEEYRSLWRTITAGGEWSGEFLNKAKDGSSFWERALITSIKDETGRITHFLAVKEDITKSKEIEEKLHQMRQQLTHVARLSTLGEMAAELAHELNHPLYAILNYAKACRNVLAEEGPPNIESLREWNGEIAEIARVAGEAVKRLRSFARCADSPHSPCRIEEIVGEAVRLVGLETRKARVIVDTAFAADLPTVPVDRVQIQQIFVNLLTNAVEAMQESPAPLRRITIRASLGGGAIEVAVADRGVGLPPDGETKIFEPYVTSKPDGMGMGLSICRTIVEAHDGRLWAESNPEGGATFHFTLPLANGGHPNGV